jgi:hypothetical protein
VASTQLDRSGGGSYGIPELVSLADEGSLRIPTFQRQFVWTAKDVRDLFDSLYRGFPVGTLLLWRHEAPAADLTLGPVSLAAPENSNALWVVDGQQRVTSLFAALTQRERSSVDDRFDVYFDLETERFTNPRRGAVSPRSIPVREALETRSLLNWLRNHSEDLESGDFDLADRLGGALRDYKIPAYIVTGEDQSLLREVFDRVNSAGKPISRAQVFHALFASGKEPGSPASVIAELRRLEFGDLDENRILQSVLALRGGDVQRDIHDEFVGHEDPADWYDLAEQALARSIDFLRGEGVRHLQMMPSTLPIPVLAAFFHLHPEPVPWVRRLLARWLWRGWVHGFGGGGGQTPVLRRAIRSVNPQHRRPDLAPSAYEGVKALIELTPDREAPRLLLENFNTKNSGPRLVMLALASKSPLDSEGQLIDLGAQYRDHGNEAVTQIAVGHRSNAANRSYWPRDAPALATMDEEQILRSHEVSRTAIRLLRTGDVDGFLRERGTDLQNLVGSFLDSRLEPGAIVRQPLQDLALTATETSGRP